MNPFGRVGLLCCGLGTLLHAGGAFPNLGLQVALVLPESPDMKLTAGHSNMAFGLHGTWTTEDLDLIRLRLDYTRFSAGNQTTSTPALSQSIDTQVSSLALGGEFLIPLGEGTPGFEIGMGVYEIRWAVKSTNRITPVSAPPVAVSGTTHWDRLGSGPVLTFRFSRRFEAEARMIFSRYGQENQPARTASIGLLWHF